MKIKFGKLLLFIIGGLVCAAVLVFLLSYPSFSRQMKDARERLASGSHILNTPQGDIEYAAGGRGIPILLLHGAGGGYDQGLWSGKVILGEVPCEFIAVSRFGYLRTPIPPAASIKLQAAQYAALLDYLKIKRAVVVGISAGGPSALEFANDFPDRCSALILLSAVTMARAPGDQDPFYFRILQLVQQSDYAYWLFAKFMQPAILNLMGVPSSVYAHFTPDQKYLAQEMLDIMHPMTLRVRGSLNDAEMLRREEVHTEAITAPVLILHARDDALVSYAHARNASRRIQKSQQLLFKTGGHGLLAQMENVRGIVIQFIKKLPDTKN